LTKIILGKNKKNKKNKKKKRKSTIGKTKKKQESIVAIHSNM
jgi:hypothetical protein